MKTFPAEILSISAVELSRRLHSREVTALDLLKTTLDRIDEVNPKICAIVALRKDRDNLFQEARNADADLDAAAAADARQEKEVGWLRGIPLAIKDLENVRGLPTTKGCPLFGKKPEHENAASADEKGFYNFGSWKFENEMEDERFVRRLRDAGAIIIGKTNVPELGMGCHSYNPIHGTTLNPYNLSLAAGGSSGGAASAIAANMLAVADGSDMMGSLRTPAGWNNLYSLRPTVEWMEEAIDNDVNNAAEDIVLPYLSTVGPLARCPEDLAMLIHTLLPGGQTHFEASSVIEEDMDDLNLLVRRSRIGWLADWGGSIPFEDGVLSQCKRLLDLFESNRGATIECIPDAPFPNDDLWDAWMVIRSYKIFQSMQESIGCERNKVIPTLKACDVKREAIWECERGENITREQLHHAISKVGDWSTCAAELFRGYDFLALPSSQVYPFDASIDWPKSISGKEMDTYHRWMNVMVPVTLLGAPCVTIPAGVGPSGLPMGVQIFAQKGNDAQLLKLARWHYRHSYKQMNLAL